MNLHLEQLPAEWGAGNGTGDNREDGMVCRCGTIAGKTGNNNKTAQCPLMPRRVPVVEVIFGIMNRKRKLREKEKKANTAERPNKMRTRRILSITHTRLIISQMDVVILNVQKKNISRRRPGSKILKIKLHTQNSKLNSDLWSRKIWVMMLINLISHLYELTQNTFDLV